MSRELCSFLLASSLQCGTGNWIIASVPLKKLSSIHQCWRVPASRPRCQRRGVVRKRLPSNGPSLGARKVQCLTAAASSASAQEKKSRVAHSVSFALPAKTKQSRQSKVQTICRIYPTPPFGYPKIPGGLPLSVIEFWLGWFVLDHQGSRQCKVRQSRIKFGVAPSDGVQCCHLIGGGSVG